SSIYFPAHDKEIWLVHAELNYLLAWIEKKLKAQGVQLVPAASTIRGMAQQDRTVDPYKTGLPGRPSIAHKIMAEFKCRGGAGETLTSICAEAGTLREWALTHHPDAPTPTRRSIENLIRTQYYFVIKEKGSNRIK